MKNSFIIFSQSKETGNFQLSLPLETPQKKPEEFASQKRKKPQISSIPGISPKERNRYRVMLDSAVIGDHLDLDAALKLAKRRNR